MYTLKDAKAIQKRQYFNPQYKEMMDVAGGYSKDRMLQILAARWAYLTKRGATTNNPKIGKSHYKDFLELSIDPREANTALIEAVSRVLGNPQSPVKRRRRT